MIALASVLAATFAALAFRAALKSNGFARLAAQASQASERAHLGAEFVIHFEPSQRHINDGSYRCDIDIHTYLLNFGRTPAENIKIISFDWRVVDSEAIHTFTPDQEIRTDQVHKGSYLPSQDRRLINRRHYSGYFNPEKYYVRRDERKSIVAAKLEFSYFDMFGNEHVVRQKAQFYGSARRTMGLHENDSGNLETYGIYNFDNTNPIYSETQRTETPSPKKKTIE